MNKRQKAGEATGAGEYGSFNPGGRRNNIRNQVDFVTGDFGGALVFNPASDFSSKTSVGVQYTSRYTLGLQIQGSGLAPGSEEVTGATSILGQESITQTVTAGGYFEEKIGWRDRLYASLAVREDGPSSF